MPYVCYILSIMISKTAVDDDVYSSRYAFVAFPSVIARISLICNPIIQFCMAKVYFLAMRIFIVQNPKKKPLKDSEIRAQTVVVLTSGKGLEHALVIRRNKNSKMTNKVTPIESEVIKILVF